MALENERPKEKLFKDIQTLIEVTADKVSTMTEIAEPSVEELEQIRATLSLSLERLNNTHETINNNAHLRERIEELEREKTEYEINSDEPILSYEQLERNMSSLPSASA